jgi:hypothetical protein
MKYVVYTLIALCSIVFVFNLTLLDYSNPFSEESSLVLIGVFTSLCAIVLLLILLVARKIKEKTEGN